MNTYPKGWDNLENFPLIYTSTIEMITMKGFWKWLKWTPFKTYVPEPLGMIEMTFLYFFEINNFFHDIAVRQSRHSYQNWFIRTGEIYVHKSLNIWSLPGHNYRTSFFGLIKWTEHILKNEYYPICFFFQKNFIVIPIKTLYFHILRWLNEHIKSDVNEFYMGNTIERLTND